MGIICLATYFIAHIYFGLEVFRGHLRQLPVMLVGAVILSFDALLFVNITAFVTVLMTSIVVVGYLGSRDYWKDWE